jgi:hypothetical protein
MTTDAEILELIQDYTHTNQYFLVEYLFLANRKHQNLRNALDSKADKDKLKEIIFDLEDHFQTSFNEVFKETCKYINRYFSQELCHRRPSIPVRISLKVIAYNQIVSLERFPPWEFEDIESNTFENSAFDYLSHAGSQEYYLCNSIPQAINEGKYKNKRIDIQKAEDYIDNYINKRPKTEKSNDSLDMEWAECWKKVRNELTGEAQIPPPESCYKSTVVSPISLSSKDLKSSEFKKFFSLDDVSISAESKAIVGYLCLDHPVENYFETKDVRFIDIVSKFLSLYMLPELGYTQYSSTYFDALNVIGGV